MDIFKLLLPIILLSTIFDVSAKDGGNIGITGMIVVSGCSLATSTTNRTWAIGNIFTDGTGNIGDILIDRTAITTLAPTNCPLGISVAMSIDGEADEDEPSLFKVASGDGKAKGVAFKIETGNNAIGYTSVSPGGKTYYQAVTVGNISFGRLNGTLVVTDSKIESGSLDTTITYTLLYN